LWFVDRSHAPLQCWQTTDGVIAEKVIAARRRFPYLGPRKLLAVLDRDAPEIDWPAASMIGGILKHAGLVTPVKRRRRPLDQGRPCTPVTGANDEWSTDFKGWFRTRDQRRIDPLTVADSHSRFLIELRILKGLFARTACRWRSTATMARHSARGVPAASPSCRPGG
jgi:putative transposase